MAEEQVASVQLLRNFAPLDAMKRETGCARQEVSVRTLSAGGAVRQGDTDKRTIWLVSGSVEGTRTSAHRALRSGTPRRAIRCIRAARHVTRGAVETSASCPSRAICWTS